MSADVSGETGASSTGEEEISYFDTALEWSRKSPNSFIVAGGAFVVLILFIAFCCCCCKACCGSSEQIEPEPPTKHRQHSNRSASRRSPEIKVVSQKRHKPAMRTSMHETVQEQRTCEVLSESIDTETDPGGQTTTRRFVMQPIKHSAAKGQDFRPNTQNARYHDHDLEGQKLSELSTRKQSAQDNAFGNQALKRVESEYGERFTPGSQSLKAQMAESRGRNTLQLPASPTQTRDSFNRMESRSNPSFAVKQPRQFSQRQISTDQLIQLPRYNSQEDMRLEAIDGFSHTRTNSQFQEMKLGAQINERRHTQILRGSRPTLLINDQPGPIPQYSSSSVVYSPAPSLRPIDPYLQGAQQVQQEQPPFNGAPSMLDQGFNNEHQCVQPMMQAPHYRHIHPHDDYQLQQPQQQLQQHILAPQGSHRLIQVSRSPTRQGSPHKLPVLHPQTSLPTYHQGQQPQIMVSVPQQRVVLQKAQSVLHENQNQPQQQQQVQYLVQQAHPMPHQQLDLMPLNRINSQPHHVHQHHTQESLPELNQSSIERAASYPESPNDIALALQNHLPTAAKSQVEALHQTVKALQNEIAQVKMNQQSIQSEMATEEAVHRGQRGSQISNGTGYQMQQLSLQPSKYQSESSMVLLQPQPIPQGQIESAGAAAQSGVSGLHHAPSASISSQQAKLAQIGVMPHSGQESLRPHVKTSMVQSTNYSSVLQAEPSTETAPAQQPFISNTNSAVIELASMAESNPSSVPVHASNRSSGSRFMPEQQ